MAKQHETELSDSEFEEYLNESYGETVSICGIDYPPGYALRLIDPVAFRCLKADYESCLDSENPRWECDICDTLHDSEDDADTCCEDRKDADDDENTSIERAPAIWASYVINGDASGLNDEEIAAADAWIKWLGNYRVVSTRGEEYFGQYEGIGYSLIDYVTYCSPK